MLPIYLRNVGVNMILVRRAARLWKKKKESQFFCCLELITIFFRNKYLLQLLPVTKEQDQKDIAHRD